MALAAPLLIPVTAQAENLGPFDVGLTAEAHLNNGFILEDRGRIIFSDAERFDDSFPYPGADGLGGLFGGLFELRYEGWLGLESGALLGYHTLDMNVRGQPTELSYTALHLPVWLKLYAGRRDSIPQYETSYLGVGVEYVKPNTPDQKTRGTFLDEATVSASWNLLLRLGMEFRLTNEALTQEPVLRFDLLRVALRADTLRGGRQPYQERPDQRLSLDGALDIQVGVGLGFGFFAL
jgi:hypothetical protein